MNNKTAPNWICPHQFYTCRQTLQLALFYDVPPLTVAPQQEHFHGRGLGKTHHECPVGMIFFRLFQFCRKCLFRHFFSVGHQVPSAFVLQLHKWSKIFGLENHLSMYTQWPFPFIFSHNLSTTLNDVLCSDFVGCATVYTFRL
jgi:hypothetical protein